MGGAFRGGGGAVAVAEKPMAEAAAKEKAIQTQATQEQEKEGARMRGARRRGRQLLSDARLSGEMGMETLGGGSNLG